LVPAWQQVKVGDLLRLHPAAGVPIELVEPGQGFVMHGVINTKTGAGAAGGTAPTQDFVNVSWLFYVVNIQGGSRFISRWRVDYAPGFKNEIMYGCYGLEPIAAVMDFKMLKGVKQRAEA
jgi:hypothetical protein